MKKKLLSIVLAVSLMVQMVPVVALANDGGNAAPGVSVGTAAPGISLETAAPGVSALLRDGVWDGTTETEPATDAGVYQIGTGAELAWFRTHVNDKSVASASNAVLTADIDLGDYNWTPIGTQTAVLEQYSGTFDGQSHTISGLSVNGTIANQGLFASINGATIKNLNVVGEVSSSNNYVGGIVGMIRSSTIENCSFSGSVAFTGTANTQHVGGIVGSNQTGPSTISGCVNMADVTGGISGGIVGYSKGTNTIIKNCYNTGTITGSSHSGGIAGQITAGTIENCYNVGEIKSTKGYIGGISGFYGITITNCYQRYPEVEASGGSHSTTSTLITSPNGLLAKLNNGGDAFVDDSDGANGGYPLLSWQTPPDTTPSVSLTGNTTIYVEDGKDNETTLSVELKNIDATAIARVTWAVETAKGSAKPEKIVKWQPADNDKTKLIVTAVGGGTVTVTATVVTTDDTEFTAYRDVSVIPQITTAEIKNINDLGAVAMGQTVEVKVFVLGGDEYDYENFPPLTYQWTYRKRSSESSTNISGETARTFHIPTNAGYNEWDYISVEIMSGGVVVKSAKDGQADLRSEDYGILYPVAYDPAFTMPEKVKDDKPLVLPAAHMVDGVTAKITWTSGNAAVINAATGAVIRPATGTTGVTLTAKCEYGTAFANKTFDITVYSRQAAEDEGNKSYLQEAVESLGEWYGPIAPVYGKDTNIADIMKTDLADNGFADLSVEVKSIEEKYDGGKIAPNGDITDFFYADPNGTRGMWLGQYEAIFTLRMGSESLDTKDFTVNLYWDRSKVEAVMRSEILGGVTESIVLAENNGRDNVVSDLVLPKAVDGKLWTLIEWSSSDPAAVVISKENQGTADTLFNPYVGKIIRGEKDKEVTLTAKFNFQRTSPSEPGIALYKTFTFTVKALTGAEADAIRAELLNKLDKGFDAVGLRDYVTGERLTEADGIYTAANDLQFPTTRDFGVDGKYFPITITGSDKDTIVAPDVANAARAVVYRPPVGAEAKQVVLTVSITDLARGISASKKFTVEVLPLIQAELDDALALMDRTKTAYFDGLNQGRYADDFSLTGGLHPFQEAVWDDTRRGRELRWIYDSDETTKNGIVADELANWAEQEDWRAFRSSDMTILDNETLNHVTQPAEDTFVRINSVLTHEVYGKYAERPGYEKLKQLSKQPVAVYVMVAGKHHPPRAREELLKMRDEAIARISAPISAGFTLRGTKPKPTSRAVEEVLIETTVGGLEAGTTVFGLFRKVLEQQGYSYKAVGSYVKAVTDAEGNTLSEGDGGPNSGWIYTVNGKMPSIYMNGYSLKEDDEVVVRFTNDYTKEDPFGGDGSDGKDESTDGGVKKPESTVTPPQAAVKKAEGTVKSTESTAGNTPDASASSAPNDSSVEAPTTEVQAPEGEALNPDVPSAAVNTDKTTSNPVVLVFTLLALAAIIAGVVWFRKKKAAEKQ